MVLQDLAQGPAEDRLLLTLGRVVQIFAQGPEHQDQQLDEDENQKADQGDLQQRQGDQIENSCIHRGLPFWFGWLHHTPKARLRPAAYAQLSVAGQKKTRCGLRIGSNLLCFLKQVGIAAAVDPPGVPLASGDAGEDGQQQRGQGQHDDPCVGAQKGEQKAQSQGAQGDDDQAPAAGVGVLVPLQTVDLLQVRQAEGGTEQEQGDQQEFLHGLHVEQEVDDVAVLHHVLLAFAADLALGLGGGHGANGLQILEGDDLGPDEAALEVGVDLASGLGSLGAPLDGPGAALVSARGQEGHQAQQRVAGRDQTVQAGLGDAQLLHEHGLLVGIVQLGDVGLQLGADGQALGALGICQGLDGVEMLVGFGLVDLVLAQVGNVDGLLQGQQVRLGDDGELLGIVGVGPGQLALVQVLQQALQQLGFSSELLVAALHGLLALVDAALHHLDIGHDQLQVDDVDVPQGIGAALDVGDVAVLKAADHVDDGVGGADVGQELVAQALAAARTLDKTGDVDELNDGGGGLLGGVEIAQPLQPLIGHGDHAHVGVDGAEGIVVGGHTGVGDGIEQGGLAHVGKSHDT